MKSSGISASRIPELDGVRGLAILSVLYWHYFAFQPHGSSRGIILVLELAGALSWAGVNLFFVLSGFLIGGILLENRDASNLLGVFYVRRVLRIFPIYFAWLIAFFVVRGLIAEKLRSPWLFSFALPAWVYATFTQNFGFAYLKVWGPHWLSVTWSLAIEEQFYLILPLAIMLLRGRRILVFSAILIITAPLVRCFLLLRGNAIAALVLLPASWDSLFLGVIGAYVFHTAASLTWRPLFMQLIHANLLAFPLISIAVAVWPRLINGLPSSLLQTLLDVVSLLFIGFAIKSPWRSILKNRWLVGMGTISYGVYLFHEGIFGLLYAITHGGRPRTGEPRISSWLDADVMLLSLAVTVVLATLSFRYFERPLTQWGRRFLYRPRLF
jgi:peptidoglycan/LPS O-acetylase OafA/YrhL